RTHGLIPVGRRVMGDLRYRPLPVTTSKLPRMRHRIRTGLLPGYFSPQKSTRETPVAIHRPPRHLQRLRDLLHSQATEPDQFDHARRAPTLSGKPPQTTVQRQYLFGTLQHQALITCSQGDTQPIAAGALAAARSRTVAKQMAHGLGGIAEKLTSVFERQL